MITEELTKTQKKILELVDKNFEGNIFSFLLYYRNQPKTKGNSFAIHEARRLIRRLHPKLKLSYFVYDIMQSNGFSFDSDLLAFCKGSKRISQYKIYELNEKQLNDFVKEIV